MSKQSVLVLAAPRSLADGTLLADDAMELAPLFRALGDPVRLRLMSMIASHEAGEICVCDLTGAFALSDPTISHHLKVLRRAGLVAAERRGTWVYYRAEEQGLATIAALTDPGGTP